MESSFTVRVARILPVVVSTLVFLPVLGFEFNLASDDLFFIWLNPSIRDTTAGGLLALVTSTNEAFNEFQPLPFLSYWVDYACYGLQPYGFYITQVILHSINVGLLFVVMESLLGSAFLAAVVSIVFGIHPLQADTVAMINQRENLLATLFALLAILSYLGWRDSRGKALWAASSLFFLLSLLSDATMVIVPVLLVLVDYYKGDAPSLAMLRSKVSLLIIMVLFTVGTVYSQSSAGMVSSYLFGSLSSQIRLITAIYADYLASFFYPVGLSTGYSYYASTLYSWKMVFSVLVNAAAILLMMVSFRRQWRSAVLGIGWFYVCLAPVCQIIPFQIARADRYMYHSLVGLAILIGAGLEAVTRGQRRPWVLIPVLAGITAVLAPLTVRNIANYADSQAYVKRLVETQGWSPSAEALLGRVYYFKGSYEEAEQLLFSAMRNETEPRKSGRRLELADVYKSMGRPTDAIEVLNQVPLDSPVRPKADKAIQTLKRSLTDHRR